MLVSYILFFLHFHFTMPPLTHYVSALNKLMTGQNYFVVIKNKTEVTVLSTHGERQKMMALLDSLS